MSLTERDRSSLQAPATLSEIERRVARYLFAIFVLSRETDGRVTTGDLEEHLDVTPASVSEMVSKLDDRGVVDYEKYQGVRLTDQGETLATQVAWRFCIVSGFFDSVLDTALDTQTAFEMGFALPEEGIVRLRELVTDPCLGLCPESGGDADRCHA